MDNPKTSRRDFCAHAISFVTVASLVESCGGSSPTSPGGGGSNAGTALPVINATGASGVVTINNVDGSALANTGSAAFIQSSDGRKFLVARTAQNSFSAVTAICTHEQCDVTRFNSGAYLCPCHGSQYSTGGAVQNGPATRALQSFATQFTNNVLTITA